MPGSADLTPVQTVTAIGRQPFDLACPFADQMPVIGKSKNSQVYAKDREFTPERAAVAGIRECIDDLARSIPQTSAAGLRPIAEAIVETS